MPLNLQTTLILLASALGGVLFARILKVPVILGYLIVGICIGPNALALAPDSATVKVFAEYGVVFLMFSIGLEFNLKKLKAMRKIVFGFGVSQVILTMLLTIPAGYFLRFLIPLALPWHVLFALGGALAMSSTAIVLKILAEKSELDTQHGKNIVGVLLFQDLVVVLLLILVPSLGKNPGDIVLALTLAGSKIAIALILILFVGQQIFSSWFNLVAKLRSNELFMLNILLVCIGMSAITQSLGLSLALGAFMAGMLISETPYRYQVEESIDSFKDILLGLFFITIGMLVDPRLVLRDFHLVLILFATAMVFKFVIIAGLARKFGSSQGVSIRTGICLAQAGEFGFVLMAQLDQLDWIDTSLSNAVVAAMLLSMLVSPILIMYNDKIALRFSRNEWLSQSLNLTKIMAKNVSSEAHIIICGFGMPGQYVANLLESEGIQYIALDADPDLVKEASEAGKSVVYGISQSAHDLIAAGIDRAKAIVITFKNPQESIRVLRQIEELNPKITIIARAKDDSDIEKLHVAGATQVIPEKTEASLMLAAHVLTVSGVPIRRVMRIMSDAREDRYGKLRGHFGEGEDEYASDQTVRLHTLHVETGSDVIGETVGDFEKCGVKVQSIRRKKPGDKNFTKIEITSQTRLQEEDIVIVLGEDELLKKVELQMTKLVI